MMRDIWPLRGLYLNDNIGRVFQKRTALVTFTEAHHRRYLSFRQTSVMTIISPSNGLG
jgi:hypothetical protein